MPVNVVLLAELAPSSVADFIVTSPLIDAETVVANSLPVPEPAVDDQ
jgi:hypothetical protein